MNMDEIRERVRKKLETISTEDIITFLKEYDSELTVQDDVDDGGIEFKRGSKEIVFCMPSDDVDAYYVETKVEGNIGVFLNDIFAFYSDVITVNYKQISNEVCSYDFELVEGAA
jgi:predicted Zn-dependent protease